MKGLLFVVLILAGCTATSTSNRAIIFTDKCEVDLVQNADK